VDLGRVGVLVALDGDRAGRGAAIKAYGVLRAVTAKIDAAILRPGRDPAEILQSDGPAALRSALRADVRPLADLVTDATIAQWDTHTAEGQVAAMRAAASMIASTLPPGSIEQILQAPSGRTLKSLGDDLRSVRSAELEAVSRVVPADVIRQILRIAERLQFDCSDITAEIANAVTRARTSPKHQAARDIHDDLGRERSLNDAVRVAMPSFPDRLIPAESVSAIPGTPPRQSGVTAARRLSARHYR
jgi:DNA primase